MIDKGTARGDLAGSVTAWSEPGRCLMESIQLWTLWQALLAPYVDCFTKPAFRHFVEWVTGLALNVEEHTITQSLIGLDRPQDWKGLENFAEYGRWDRQQVERVCTQVLEEA